MNIDTVEFVLSMKKIIEGEFESDPRLKLQKMKINMVKGGLDHKERHRGNEDESDEDE